MVRPRIRYRPSKAPRPRRNGGAPRASVAPPDRRPRSWLERADELIAMGEEARRLGHVALSLACALQAAECLLIHRNLNPQEAAR